LIKYLRERVYYLIEFGYGIIIFNTDVIFVLNAFVDDLRLSIAYGYSHLYRPEPFFASALFTNNARICVSLPHIPWPFLLRLVPIIWVLGGFSGGINSRQIFVTTLHLNPTWEYMMPGFPLDSAITSNCLPLRMVYRSPVLSPSHVENISKFLASAI
jgi:hypothetical protein